MKAFIFLKKYLTAFFLLLITSTVFSQGILQVLDNKNNNIARNSVINYGDINLNSSKVFNFNLKNIANGKGKKGLKKVTVSISGNDFSVTNSNFGNLKKGTQVTLPIKFSPSSEGLKTAVVTISYNNGVQSSYKFILQGKGQAADKSPEINVYDETNLVNISNGGSSTNFGNLAIGTSSVFTIRIENTGHQNSILDLLSNPIFTSNVSGYFTVTSLGVTQLGGGDSTTFTITFTPLSVGSFTADISIANNDSDENPYNFRIQGTGTAPQPNINIQGNSISIADGDSTPDVSDGTNFGTTDTVMPSVSTFTMQNNGSADLVISGISSDNGVFSIESLAYPLTITSGSSYDFAVSFLPTGNGTEAGTITVNTNVSSPLDIYTYAVGGAGTTGPPQYTAYFESFDVTNGGWSSITETNDKWLWVSSYPASITDEIVEGSFWRNTNFDSYSNNTNIEVESPFYDFTDLKNLELSLDVKYETEDNDDGMRILYSIGGAAYTILGASGDGVNWYDDSVSTFGTDGWNNTSHSGTPTFSGSYNHFMNASITLSDAIFSGQSDVKFKIEFKSDGASTNQGVGFDNFLIKADPITDLNNATVAPANINNNLRLWLKTNAGITSSDGNSLISWQDQAYDTDLDKEDAFSSSSLAPTYRDNASRNLNFNPVADFDSSNKEYLQGKGGYFSQDYFVVVKSDDIIDKSTGSSGRQFPIGGRFSEDNFHEDPTGLAFGSSTGRYVDEVIAHNQSSYANSSTTPGVNSYGRAYTSSSNSFQHVLIVNVKANAGGTAKEIYKNGKKIDNKTGTTGTTGTGTDLIYSEFNNIPFLLGTGRSGIAGRSSSQLNGRLTEIISYTSPNSAINQQKIQSYLGIKYGVTLQDVSTTLTDYRLNDVDYIDSQGATIWDSSQADINGNYYNYDIAGIGRDDASVLNQKQSRSQNDESDTKGPTSGILTIGLSDIYNTNKENINDVAAANFNDREFLCWGNNDQPLDGTALSVEVDMSAGIGDTTLKTPVSFEAIQRIWRVVENGGDIPSVKVSIPTSAVRSAVPPDGRYLMFISDTGIFDPTADYRVMTESGGNLYAEYDFDGTKYITFGWAPEEEYKRSIYFNPANQHYIDMEDNLDLNSTEFTISAWIKRGASSANTSILSKRNVGYTEGYDFKIDGLGKVEMSWGAAGVEKITSNTTIPENVWHQVAVIYKDKTASIYIDGVLDKTVPSLSDPVNTNSSFFIAAACKNIPEAYFDGNIDEVRVWDIALSENQLHYIMNQEIEENATFVGGKIIPTAITNNEFNATLWDKLTGYYPMSVYTYTNTKDESGKGHQGALRNLNTVDWQTAPLPYESEGDGTWDTPSTWLNNTVQDIPNSVSIVDGTVPVDWNIVETNHNITSGNPRDITMLAWIQNGQTVTMEGAVDLTTGIGTGNGITVTHYLYLGGILDLEGESQLVQTEGSILASSSPGYLERDQQGTANSFNYNYWTFPVGPIGGANNAPFQIENVLFDGRDPSKAIVYNVSAFAADSGPTGANPITMSTYWLYKFHGPEDSYDAWANTDQTTTFNSGEGFTMKGSLGDLPLIGNFQNYVFRGKPYNGDVTLTLDKSLAGGADVGRLIGNPYSSAIDVAEFIDDNLIATNGTIYLWDHFGEEGTHVLKEYVGGYATRNILTGAPAISTDSRINNAGTPSGTKIPGRYIAVGQAFFVNTLGGAPGGNIVFKNSQRVFKTEAELDASSNPISVFMKGENVKGKNTQQVKTTSNQRPIIRLAYDSPLGYHRQIVVGTDEKATNGIDKGYDAYMVDVGKEDMYWNFADAKFVIQGVSNFNIDQELPIGLVISKTGMIRVKIEALENIDTSTNIYIKDALTGTTTQINNEPFEIELETGEYLNRFSLTFAAQKTLRVEDEILENGVHLFMNNTTSEIQIRNTVQAELLSVKLYNSLGQLQSTWNKNLEAVSVALPVNIKSTGMYLVQINTTTGTISKKIIIK